MGVTTYMHITKGMRGKHEMCAGLMLDPTTQGMFEETRLPNTR